MPAQREWAHFHQAAWDRGSPTPAKSIELQQCYFSSLCKGLSTVGELWDHSWPLPHNQVAPNKNLQKYMSTEETGDSDYFEIAVF